MPLQERGRKGTISARMPAIMLPVREAKMGEGRMVLTDQRIPMGRMPLPDRRMPKGKVLGEKGKKKGSKE